MDKLYVCRHGETDWTLSGQHTGKTDLSLTSRGKEQASFLRRRLAPIHFKQVFSSPKKRALETCQGLNPRIEMNAQEWDYGDYEGLTSKQIHETDPDWDLYRKGAPNGESVEEVLGRVDRLLDVLISCEGTVALFSHGHFLRLLATRFLGLDPSFAPKFLLSVASIGILSFEKKVPSILLWNDTSHLDSIQKPAMGSK